MTLFTLNKKQKNPCEVLISRARFNTSPTWNSPVALMAPTCFFSEALFPQSQVPIPVSSHISGAGNISDEPRRTNLCVCKGHPFKARRMLGLHSSNTVSLATASHGSYFVVTSCPHSQHSKRAPQAQQV